MIMGRPFATVGAPLVLMLVLVLAVLLIGPGRRGPITHSCGGVARCSAGSGCRVFWLEVNPIESFIARLIHDSSEIGRRS
jgi:hypothetical protein